MRGIAVIVALLVCGVVGAREAIDFLGSADCPVLVDVSLPDGGVMTITLTQSDVLIAVAVVSNQEQAQFWIPSGALSYRIQGDGDGLFVFTTQTLCSTPAPEESPIPEMKPVDDGYAALESEMFRRMNWGSEEIEWFRRTYSATDDPGMFGTQRDYIYAVADLYEQLDAETTPTADN